MFHGTPGMLSKSGDITGVREREKAFEAYAIGRLKRWPARHKLPRIQNLQRVERGHERFRTGQTAMQAATGPLVPLVVIRVGILFFMGLS